MQVDINITIPASMLLLSARGCYCKDSISINDSIILLPSNTFPDSSGRYGYYDRTPSRWITGVEYPCNGPTQFTFELGILYFFGATTDFGLCFSGATYDCALGSFPQVYNPGGRWIDNSGNRFLVGHPCTTPAGKTVCCLTGSKTYDFIVNPGLGGSSIGTYTATFL